MLKKIEISVLRTFNSYRVPFLAFTMTFCLVSAGNTRRSIVARAGPALFVMPFVTMYNHHVGMYGVHKKIDSILDEIVSDKFADEKSEVRQKTEEFLSKKNQQ